MLALTCLSLTSRSWNNAADQWKREEDQTPNAAGRLSLVVLLTHCRKRHMVGLT